MKNLKGGYETEIQDWFELGVDIVAINTHGSVCGVLRRVGVLSEVQKVSGIRSNPRASSVNPKVEERIQYRLDRHKRKAAMLSRK